MSDRTYPVPVDGVGTFTFRRRAMRDQFRIHAETLRILGGDTDDVHLWNAAFAMATLLHLTVAAPDGWDVEALDPLDPEDVTKLFTVSKELAAAEARFRKGSGA